jgi:hypothetical protein
LRQELCENADVRQDDKQDYPTHLADSRDVIATKEISGDSYEQPKPQDQHKHRECVGHEIGECEATLK